MLQVKYMHYFSRCTLDGLEDHVVLLWLLELHDCEEGRSHLVLEWLLAELALDGLPEVTGHLFALIDYTLAVEPLFETVDVDLAHGATAFAGHYHFVVRFFF
jgi:hypothetical protein